MSVIRDLWRDEPLASVLGLVGLGFLAGAWWNRRSRALAQALVLAQGGRPFEWDEAGRAPRAESPPPGATWRPGPPEPGAERASVLGYQRAATLPPPEEPQISGEADARDDEDAAARRSDWRWPAPGTH